MSSPRGWGEPTWGQESRPQTASDPVDTAGPAPLLGLGALMDQVIAVLRWAPTTIWAFGGGVVALVTILQAIVVARFGLAGYLDRLAADDLASVDAQIPVLLASAGVSTLGWLTGLLAGALAAGVAAVVVVRFEMTDDDASRAAPPSPRAVWRSLRPRLGGTLALAILLALAPATLLLPAIGWAVAAGATANSLTGALLLTLAAAVAAFWVLPVLAIAIPEYVAPTPGAVGGPLGRAARLVRGNRWRLVGVWLLTTIVLGIASGAVSAPFGWLATALMGSDGSSGEAAALLLGGAVAAAVTAPIGAVVLALAHADLSHSRRTTPGAR